MDKITQPSKSRIRNKITKWARIIHRDLGFLMVGVCLVYAISGILLNHMNGKDPAFHTEEVTIQLSSGLNKEDLMVAWNDKKGLPVLRKVLPLDDEHLRLMLEGGVGVYNMDTGTIDYEKYTKREFVYWINKLHYNKVKGWSIMGDFFAASLIFFALSGLVMVRGKNGIMERGKWYLIVGLLIPVVYVIVA
ncbi:PepSY-associated TM helix domain-containing protein [Dysgonomonas sp. Marseille-P4677]|uniref:PepSY-associated TM helix domain-containing protein n=1 Tax=Dysgonomonas sp. Marseille-P4677 TaxID=2364790 RepID=UPI00191466BD|nr:PepSY-associated TM helix domain-containing protein [Dysgonomonas sp. Marseille-P4677]MBK5720973.1 PepSY-associated TM helix domain-containing protein [Dysgonomonas sp. Marseille-P4677]